MTRHSAPCFLFVFAACATAAWGQSGVEVTHEQDSWSLENQTAQDGDNQTKSSYSMTVETTCSADKTTTTAEKWRETCTQACGAGRCARCEKQCVCPTCTIAHKYPRDESYSEEESEEQNWEAEVDAQLADIKGQAALSASVKASVKAQVKTKKSKKTEKKLSDVPLPHGVPSTISEPWLKVKSDAVVYSADFHITGWYERLQWEFFIPFVGIGALLASDNPESFYEVIHVNKSAHVVLYSEKHESTQIGYDTKSTCECGSPAVQQPPGEPPVSPPPPGRPSDGVKTGQNPPGAHRFREPVRVGVADEVSLFSTTVSVVPEKKFAVPAAIRAKDGGLIAVNEVWVQPEGEDPKPLAHVGDAFTGTTPPKPAKIFAVVAGTAVGIIHLLPDGGSGGSGDPGAIPPKIADPVATPPAGSPSSPVTTSVAAPSDFPTKAPVVELTPRTPPEGVTPIAGTPPTTETPPVAENPPPAPTSTPSEPTASQPPSSGPTKAPAPDVRMAENEPTLIATEGVFNPDAVPAMGAELAFPDQKIRRAGDVIFSTEDTALVRTMGSADQTGDMVVTVTDPEGNAQIGTANAWTAKLALSQEVLKEGQALAIQIVPTGLDETRRVKYRLELSADAKPLTPGATGQTYTGETTVSALRALVFRARYDTSGAKPMKLFLEPLPEELSTPRSPGEK